MSTYSNYLKSIGHDVKGGNSNMFGAIAGAALGIGSSVANYFSQKKANQLQEDTLDYQKALNEQVMAREDSAYQRTVADMEKAGLNPLSINSVNSASSLSSGQAPTTVPEFDVTNAVSALNTLTGSKTQLTATALNNATSEFIAQMQQHGVDMANAYSYEVGMANAFANQLKAITEFKRSGIDDPAVLKALKEQIIAEAKNAQNNARGSGTTADLLDQEYQGRSKSGTYRGMPEKVSTVREAEQYGKEKIDAVSSAVSDSLSDDKTGLGKIKPGENYFTKILTALNASNKAARKQASRQLLSGARRRR